MISGFQFQCGAIESYYVIVNRTFVRPFQFQCGAIERKMFLGLRHLYTSFNSSVVRLRVRISLVLAHSCYPFQFQCGAIESLLGFLTFGASGVFQFQCGAIERSK